MRFVMSVMQHPRYLHLVASGPAELADLLTMGSVAEKTSRLQRQRRALFDVLAVEPLFSDAERLELGARLAGTLAVFEKVAWVFHPNKYSGVAHKEITERGVNLCVFTDLETATAWLTSGPLASQE